MKTITKFRTLKGWSMNKLAHESGVSQACISQLEAGKKSPTTTTLGKLSKALEVPVAKLLEESA